MLFLLQITWYGHVTHAYWSARYSLKSYGSRNSPGVIWGHRGQKFIFIKNVITHNSYTVNSLNIKLVHVHKLETLYLFWGGHRSIWGHMVLWWVKSLFWYNLYITLSWAWTVAGWETTLSRARSVVGWETKLRGASHLILVASSSYQFFKMLFLL